VWRILITLNSKFLTFIKCAEEAWCWFWCCSIHTDRRRWCGTSLSCYHWIGISLYFIFSNLLGKFGLYATYIYLHNISFFFFYSQIAQIDVSCHRVCLLPLAWWTEHAIPCVPSISDCGFKFKPPSLSKSSVSHPVRNGFIRHYFLIFGWLGWCL
jgi:hypothetical protein